MSRRPNPSLCLALFLFASSVSLLGCGDDTETTDGGSAPSGDGDGDGDNTSSDWVACLESAEGSGTAAEQRLADCFLRGLCIPLASCCDDVGVAGVTLSRCGDMLSTGLSYDAEIAAGHVTVDRSALRSCLEQLDAIATTCSLTGVDHDRYDLCNQVLIGHVAADGECATGVECEGTVSNGLRGLCVIPEGTRTGTCYATEIAAVGEPCIRTDSGFSGPVAHIANADENVSGRGVCRLSDGLYCKYDTKRCARVAESSETCSDGYCALGLGCDESYHCSPPGGVGAACDSGNQCADELICQNGECDDTAVRTSECESLR